MSFRCPFVTDFIYQASDEFRDANPKVTEVFKKYARLLSSEIDDRGYGFYSGLMKNLDSSIQDTGVVELVSELEKVTKVPFRLSILLESGPAITFEVKPRV